MNWTIEVVQVPVSDVQRSLEFYGDRLGFKVDHDTDLGGGNRFVQLTPAGSGCSIVLGAPVKMKPGSMQGVQLVVSDLVAARQQLLDRDVDVSEITVMGPEGERPYEEGDELDNVGFCHVSDPDGNGWAIQQISSRR